MLSGFGPGWMPAIINSETELETIRAGQRGLSDDQDYWIGGSSFVTGAIDLSNYSTQGQGSGEQNMANDQT